MSLKFVNRICPNCGNPNYMVWVEDFKKGYKYKCVNCHRFFNDIDFEKEPLQPDLKSKCMNTKADMVEVVRCKNCKNGEPGACGYGIDCDGFWHDDDWYCADGERRDDDD